MKNKIISILAVIFLVGSLFLIGVVPASAADTITDLTGTSWRFNSSISAPNLSPYSVLSFTFELSISSSGFSYSLPYVDSSGQYSYTYTDVSLWSSKFSNPPYIVQFGTYGTGSSSRGTFFRYTSSWEYVLVRGSSTVTPVEPPVVTFTGGSGVTNSTFISWLSSNATQIVSGYTVSFNTMNADDDTGLPSETWSEIPSDIDTSYVPTRDNCTFGGWYYDIGCTQKVTAGDSVTQDITLYAKWNYNTSYTLYRIVNGQFYDSLVTSAGNVVADFLGVPDSSASFGGWYYDANSIDSVQLGQTVYPDRGVLEIYGTLTSTNPLYTVYFASGQNATTYPPYYGSTLPDLSEYTPTRQGYRFDGWYLDASYSSAATSNAPLSSDVTLYAKWTQTGTTRVVRRFVNGLLYDTISFVGDTIPSNVLSNPLLTYDVSFDGWYHTFQQQGSVSVGDTINSDINIYARAYKNENTIRKFTITYQSVGGNYIPPYYTLGLAASELPTTSRVGYTFAGWYVNSNYTVPYISNGYYPNGVTLYADWTQNSQTGDYNDGYQQGVQDGQQTVTLVNVLWQGFYSAFSDFSNQTSIGGVSIGSVLISIALIALVWFIWRLVKGG